MPTPVLPTEITATMSNLSEAHAVGRLMPDGSALVIFGARCGMLELTDTPAVVRQLLTDALAQLDAAEASR